MALPSNIIQARERARQAETQAGQFTAALPTIGDVLKKSVNKLFNENQDIMKQFSAGVSDLISAPGKSFELFSNVTDPFTRERLASDFVGTQSQAPLTQAGLLGQRVGRISDIVEAGTGAFTAQATQIANAADRARKTYLDLLDEFKTLEDIRLREEAIAASRASGSGGPGFTERQSVEVQELIREAGKLPEGQRKAFIIANGYNPDSGEFTGLFAPQVTLQQQKTQEEITKLRRENAEELEKSAGSAFSPGNIVSQFQALPQFLRGLF